MTTTNRQVEPTTWFIPDEKERPINPNDEPILIDMNRHDIHIMKKIVKSSMVGTSIKSLNRQEFGELEALCLNEKKPGISKTIYHCNRLVGFIVCIPYQQGKGLRLSFGLVESARRMGVMTKVIRQVKECLLEATVSVLSVDVALCNDETVQFLNRFGFIQQGESKKGMYTYTSKVQTVFPHDTLGA